MELSSPTNFPRYRTSSRLLRRPSVIVRSLREPPDVLLDVPRRALQRPWRTLAQRKSVGFAARGVRKQMSREELTFQIKLPYPKTELISSPLRVWLYGAGLRKFRRSETSHRGEARLQPASRPRGRGPGGNQQQVCALVTDARFKRFSRRSDTEGRKTWWHGCETLGIGTTQN